MHQTGHWFHDNLQKNKGMSSFDMDLVWPDYDAKTHLQNKHRFIGSLIFDISFLVFAMWLLVYALIDHSWILALIFCPVVWTVGSYLKWNIEDYRAYTQEWIQAGRPEQQVKKDPQDDDQDDGRPGPPQPPIWHHF